MKKFGFFAVALAAAVVGLVSCDKKDKDKVIDDSNALPNGFYVSVVGNDLVAENAMDQGINEVDQSARTGMYEKYTILEAGKEYEFVNKKGANSDHYGAALEYGDTLIATDNKAIAGYKGSLVADAKVSVKETALYHIVLDFNEDGTLTDVGGAQCIIVPVKWGVRGAMNSWGFTEAEVAGNIYSWKNVTVETAGKFKFAHNECWKINLDIANLVKANTNLGNECKPGGDDIAIDRAVYDITLEYVGPAATTQESFKYSVTKVKDLEVLLPETFIYSFIGSIIDDSWSKDVDFTYVSTEGKHYVFEAKDLDFKAGEFKIRFDHKWDKSFGSGAMTIEGVTVTDNGGNCVLAEAFNGSAKFEFDWNGSAEENVKLTFITAE